MAPESDRTANRAADEARLAALMRAAQDGDAAAYAMLLRLCLPLVRAEARAQGVPPDHVDDVVQETLLTIHRVRHTYDPTRPFTPWLRAIAARRAVDGLRRRIRHQARELHAPLAYETHPDPAAPAWSGLIHAERAQRLGAEVAALPEGQRQAVEELGMRENTLAEASARTGRTPGALKVNLHRALKALRQRLAGDDGDV